MHTAVRRTLFASLSLLMTVGVARAHHSFAAEYDVRRPVTFSGRVTSVRWINPHVRFSLDVADPAGVVTNWQFEMGAVNGLLRRGWSRDLLKVGDTVTVDGYLAREVMHLANARVITLSNGRQMSGGTMPDPEK